MNKILEKSLLFDFYGELLTEHQKEIYEDYALNDYSLSEIAQDRGISRQGVHDSIKRTEKILDEYERTLGLVEKFLKIKEHVAEIKKDTELFKESKDIKHIDDIDRISALILEEL